jgi:hypothetical protein
MENYLVIIRILYKTSNYKLVTNYLLINLLTSRIIL